MKVSDRNAKLAAAVREKCVECVGGESEPCWRREITNCTATPEKCKVWPFRKGNGNGQWARGYKQCVRREAVRNECLLCMGGSRDEPESCTNAKCSLYPYRKPTVRQAVSPESGVKIPPPTLRRRPRSNDLALVG